MSEAIAFPKELKLPRTPVPAVIRFCKILLEQAEKGDLQAVAIATVWATDLLPGGEVNSGWASGSGTYHALNTAIAKLYRARGRYCDDIPEEVLTPPAPSA